MRCLFLQIVSLVPLSPADIGLMTSTAKLSRAAHLALKAAQEIAGLLCRPCHAYPVASTADSPTIRRTAPAALWTANLVAPLLSHSAAVAPPVSLLASRFGSLT